MALSGYSSSPSASDGEQAIQQRIKNESAGRVKLTQFHKTDGQSAEVNGVKLYTLEYDAEVEFLEACKWDVITQGGVLMDDELHFGTEAGLGTGVSKGQRIKLVGAIQFEQKESGWAVASVKLKSFTALKSPSPPQSEQMFSANSPSFADAEAWQIRVKETWRFPKESSRPAFSHDFRRIAYLVAGPADEEPVGLSKPWEVRLVVRWLESRQATRTIRVPVEATFMPRTIAWSPDDKRIAMASYEGGGGTPGTNMFFIDLTSSKVTGVRFDKGVSQDGLIFWPAPTTLVVTYRLGSASILEIDTLKVLQDDRQEDRPKELRNYDYRAMEFGTSNHKNCVLNLRSYGFKGLDGKNLVVDSRHRAHTRVLLQNTVQDDGVSDDWIFWTPDLQYVVFHPPTVFQPRPATLVHLGETGSPILDFRIDTAADSLSPEQLGQLKSAFASGKRVWASVFGKRVNPLNDRMLGPDEGQFRGQGYLTQIEPALRFTYSFEVAPGARYGDVASHFMVENAWDWGSQVWGQLTTAVGPASSESRQAQSQSGPAGVVPVAVGKFHKLDLSARFNRPHNSIGVGGGDNASFGTWFTRDSAEADGVPFLVGLEGNDVLVSADNTQNVFELAGLEVAARAVHLLVWGYNYPRDPARLELLFADGTTQAAEVPLTEWTADQPGSAFDFRNTVAALGRARIYHCAITVRNPGKVITGLRSQGGTFGLVALTIEEAR